MNRISLTDRLVSAVSYITFGIFSVIWFIFAHATNKQTSEYMRINLIQSIVISLVLAGISMIYSLALNLISMIPFIGNLAKSFNLYFNQTPNFFGCTLSGLIVSALVLYLVTISLIGKTPYVPGISGIVDNNFGG